MPSLGHTPGGPQLLHCWANSGREQSRKLSNRLFLRKSGRPAIIECMKAGKQ
ncbi:hypothetical protein IscW_ISCW003318 [Ixodes scapularis]|uniref:Uncharacterized protein n=1 Tax=Ixodes scapularis TaxID=6945 RepID=B7PCR7_IXOSC|nr:hypothetical protein IscW_ISCW003318 [Ixodes scapularis]|eukprot:XP_002410162.1 hypothetical protein IscW_ISCW003318 [Ixodes scapularis]